MSSSESSGYDRPKHKQSLSHSEQQIIIELHQSKPLHKQSSQIQSKDIHPFPDLSSPSYKLTLQSILQLFSSLDAFTDHLERKVDNLLKAQQNQFVESYQLHMTKIRKEFEDFEENMKKLHQKIKYYENQGKMSKLIGKNHQLQVESKDLYSIIAAKDKKVKDMELTIKVQKDQIKRLQGKVKAFLRQKSQNILTKFDGRSQISLENIESTGRKNRNILFFPTQIQKSEQRGTLSIRKEFSTAQNGESYLKHSSKGKSFKSGTINLLDDNSLTNDGINITNRLKKQVSQLKTRNKKLVSFHSKVIDAKLQLEQFFIDTVQQIKKEVKIRKKMNECTFEDFKKQDKLNLLIKILSNDEILGYLYERIFRKKETPLLKTRVKGLPSQKPQGGLDALLPKISFNLEFQKKN